MIVDNCRKLVGGKAVIPVNDEIFRGNYTRAVNRVIEPDHLPVGAESPGRVAVLTGARRGFLTGMWCLRCKREFAPARGRRVNEITGAKFFERGGIRIAALTLEYRCAVPVETEPTQIFDSLLDITGFDAHPVKIINPQHDASAGCARRQPRDEKRARVAEVQTTAGRRSKSAGNHG